MQRERRKNKNKTGQADPEEMRNRQHVFAGHWATVAMMCLCLVEFSKERKTRRRSSRDQPVSNRAKNKYFSTIIILATVRRSSKRKFADWVASGKWQVAAKRIRTSIIEWLTEASGSSGLQSVTVSWQLVAPPEDASKRSSYYGTNAFLQAQN